MCVCGSVLTPPTLHCTAFHCTALHSTPKIAWCDLLIALLALSSDVEKRAREASAAAGEPEPRYIHVLSDPYSLTHTLLHILYTLYSILYTLYSILYTLYSILYTLYSLLTPHSSRTINALKTQRRGVRASVRCSTTVGQSRCAAVSKVLRFISLHHIHTASILAPSVLTLTLTLLHVTHTHTQAPRGCAAGGRVGGGAGQYIEL
jgi:hypothetical protein